MTILSRQNYRSKGQPECGQITTKPISSLTDYEKLVLGLRLHGKEITDENLYRAILQMRLNNG